MACGCAFLNRRLAPDRASQSRKFEAVLADPAKRQYSGKIKVQPKARGRRAAEPGDLLTVGVLSVHWFCPGANPCGVRCWYCPGLRFASFGQEYHWKEFANAAL